MNLSKAEVWIVTSSRCLCSIPPALLYPFRRALALRGFPHSFIRSRIRAPARTAFVDGSLLYPFRRTLALRGFLHSFIRSRIRAPARTAFVDGSLLYPLRHIPTLSGIFFIRLFVPVFERQLDPHSLTVLSSTPVRASPIFSYFINGLMQKSAACLIDYDRNPVYNSNI